MKNKLLWITRTGALLALLVCLQSVTKPFGQLVTGSCVNALLALSALISGFGSALTIAVISPVLACLLGIAPQLVTVPAIMAGNAVFVSLLICVPGKTPSAGSRIAGLLVAAFGKFAVLYLLVVKIICGIASAPLLSAGVLKPPMLEKLPGMFALPQLLTALIGGSLALAMVPVLNKAVKK